MCNGFILWQGNSLIDGKPIVVVATTSSRNVKTGSMVQTWILRDDIDPISAVQSGGDYSICGSCPLRGEACGDHVKGRLCYVKFWQAPNQIWKAYKRGSYPVVTRSEACRLVQDKALRIGSYGEPTAVPFRVWSRLATAADSYTGYSHRWAIGANWRYRYLCMASVESLADASKAELMGWRAFRILSDVSEKENCEVLCPASKEGGYRTTCENCCRCSGGIGRSVAIVVHGGPAIVSNYAKVEK